LDRILRRDLSDIQIWWLGWTNPAFNWSPNLLIYTKVV
jgi:hypothetical protein